MSLWNMNSILYLSIIRTQFYWEHIGKSSWRHQRGETAKLFQFLLMTVLQHRQCSAVLSTEGMCSKRFNFFHNLISFLRLCMPVFAFCLLCHCQSYFCLDFCIFLPLSVIFQVSLWTDIQSHKSVTALSDKHYLFSLAYFQSFSVPQKVEFTISLFLNKEILIAVSSKRSESWLAEPPSMTLVTVCKLTSCLLAAAQNLRVIKTWCPCTQYRISCLITFTDIVFASISLFLLAFVFSLWTS